MVSKKILDDFRSLLFSGLGLNLNEKYDNELFSKIKLAAESFGYQGIDEFVKWLTSSDLTQDNLSKLATFFTIGESYFLRERTSFDFLEKIYLPELIKRRTFAGKELRIWSAGCSSGEEPYSIAILLKKCIPDIHNWKISLIATDINPNFLAKAKEGIYTRWSFRNCPESFVEKYFTEIDVNRFQLSPEIMRMVKFSTFNLAKDIYPSIKNGTNNIDILFCRNVMIYFSQEGIRGLSERFFQSLSNDGILVLSPVEMTGLISSEFGKRFYEGFTFYTKDQNRPVDIAEKYIININKPEIPEHFVPAEKFVHSVTSLIEEKVEDKTADQYMTYLLLSGKEANVGNYTTAVELCNNAIELNKTCHSAYYLKALIMHETGDDVSAIELLNYALYLNQNLVLAHFQLGNIKKKHGKFAESKKHMKNAKLILAKCDPDEIVQESDGLTAGSLLKIIG